MKIKRQIWQGKNIVTGKICIYQNQSTLYKIIWIMTQIRWSRSAKMWEEKKKKNRKLGKSPISKINLSLDFTFLSKFTIKSQLMSRVTRVKKLSSIWITILCK